MKIKTSQKEWNLTTGKPIRDNGGAAGLDVLVRDLKPGYKKAITFTDEKERKKFYQAIDFSIRRHEAWKGITKEQDGLTVWLRRPRQKLAPGEATE